MTGATLATLVALLPDAGDRAAKDALDRFPSLATAQACERLADWYLDAARARWRASPVSWQDAAGEEVAEAEVLRDAWQALACARSTWAAGSYHRDRLRQLLGPQAWAAGVMPPPVPAWRFRLVD